MRSSGTDLACLPPSLGSKRSPVEPVSRWIGTERDCRACPLNALTREAGVGERWLRLAGGQRAARGYSAMGRMVVASARLRMTTASFGSRKRMISAAPPVRTAATPRGRPNARSGARGGCRSPPAERFGTLEALRRGHAEGHVARLPARRPGVRVSPGLVGAGDDCRRAMRSSRTSRRDFR